MPYEFDRIVDRWNLGSAKWEMMKAALGKGCEDVLAVSTADMDFPVIPEVRDAMHEAVDRFVYGYTVPTPEFYRAVADWLARRHRWNIKEEWIVCSPGIVSALYYSLYAFTQEGDAVIIQQPVYAPFASSINATKRKVLNNPLVYREGAYTIDFEGLEKKAALPEAKMMFLCSPHNPVGRLWTEEELNRIARICVKYDILLVSDEIHFDLVFPPREHFVYGRVSEAPQGRFIVCTSPSKTFNLAGLQISSIIIPDPQLRKRFKDSALACGFYSPNVFAPQACIAAYEKGEAWLAELLEYLRENDLFVREYIAEHLPRLTLPPLEATYLQWIDCSALPWDHLERERRLREEGCVFFESGHIFGSEGRDFERFNIGLPRFLVEEVLQRFRKVYEQ